MRLYLPSRIDLRKNERSIQLQFTGAGFEMRLFERGHSVGKAVPVTAAQLRQVGIDLRAVTLPPLRFLYLDRYVVVELEGKEWARVPDVSFMRLLELAVQGAGVCIDLTQARPS